MFGVFVQYRHPMFVPKVSFSMCLVAVPYLIFCFGVELKMKARGKFFGSKIIKPFCRRRNKLARLYLARFF